jgi:hypothetical protein
MSPRSCPQRPLRALWIPWCVLGCTTILNVNFDGRLRSDAGANDAAPAAIDRRWSMWKILPESPLNLSEQDGIVYDGDTDLYWEKRPSDFGFDFNNAKARCEDLSLEGYDDFRIPTRIELGSIVKYVKPPPKIDSRMEVSSQSYWTLSTAASDPGQSWIIDFNRGVATPSRRELSRSVVRCVRGGKSVPNSAEVRFQAAEGGTVFDKITGLIWEANSTGPYSDKEARIHCQLRTGGFRVPSLHELNTIIDETRVAPALSPLFGASGLEWILNPVGGAPNEAYAVDTTDGTSLFLNPDPARKLYVRCVR